MAVLRFHLSISTESLLRHYAGGARDVVAVAEDGCKVRFPATRLRPHVRPGGVHGEFELEYDEAGRFIRLVRVG